MDKKRILFIAGCLAAIILTISLAKTSLTASGDYWYLLIVLHGVTLVGALSIIYSSVFEE